MYEINEIEFNYDEAFTESDDIINEAVEKLKERITEKAKSELEMKDNRITSLSNQVMNLEETRFQQSAEISKLKDELAELKKEKEKVPEFKYNIGDVVYITRIWDRKMCNCPTCTGTGFIETETTEYGKVKAYCPTCNHESYKKETGRHLNHCEYEIYLADAKRIKGLNYHIEKDSNGNINAIQSYILEAGYTVSEDSIYSNQKEATEAVKIKNELEKKIAEAKVNGKYNYEEDKIIDE